MLWKNGIENQYFCPSSDYRADRLPIINNSVNMQGGL